MPVVSREVLWAGAPRYGAYGAGAVIFRVSGYKIGTRNAVALGGCVRPFPPPRCVVVKINGKWTTIERTQAPRPPGRAERLSYVRQRPNRGAKGTLSLWNPGEKRQRLKLSAGRRARGKASIGFPELRNGGREKADLRGEQA